jgi:RNA polymerase sigma-70 factor (ECF subfamily)
MASAAGAEPDNPGDGPLSAEATVELLDRVKKGDQEALNLLLARVIPRLRRWAHGRLPQSARGMQETADLVQDTILAAVKRIDVFEVRHQGALQAFLRQCVMNRIRDIARFQQRRPQQTDLPDQVTDPAPSPLQEAIGAQNMERYERALARLEQTDREAIIGRLELQNSYDELAVALNKPTAAAARMAVTRAMKRLAEEMRHA